MFIALRTLANRIERRLRFRLVTRRRPPLDADDLPFADLGVVDIEDFDLVFVLQAIFVDADDDVFGLVDAGLASSGGLLDQPLGQAFGDGLRHSAAAFSLLAPPPACLGTLVGARSVEHTYELQSLIRISYSDCCL